MRKSGDAEEAETVGMSGSSPLLTFRQAVLPAGDGLSIGPIDWSIAGAARIRVEAETPELVHALFSALAGLSSPVSGSIAEQGAVVVQGDFLLWEQLDPGRSIEDYLRAPDAPESVWLENRRRSPGVLLEKLGLYPNFLRRPLKFQPRGIFEKFVAFRFLTSRAHLLLARDLFRVEDEAVREALRLRWRDISGTVIAAAKSSQLPGPVDAEARLDASGAFVLTAAAGRAQSGPPG